MKLSFIIPTLGICPIIDDVIKSIVETTNIPFEILLINNGKNKNFAPQFQPKELKVLYSDLEYGLGRAYNIGIENSQGEYLVYLHDDCTINQRYWYEKAINMLENDPSIDLLVGSSYYLWGDRQYYKNYFGTFEQPQWGQFLPGLIAKHRAHKFDEDYHVGHEDVQYSIDVWKRGKKVIHYPIDHIHIGGVSTNESKSDINFRAKWEGEHKRRSQLFIEKNKDFLPQAYIERVKKEVLL